MPDNRIMYRGVQQALNKYLPGSWVDFSQSGGGLSYAVHVDSWNSVPLTNINSRRLLRVVAQRVREFAAGSPDGSGALDGFSATISEETYDVLTPRVGSGAGAIRTSVNPLLFACSACGKVRQYRSYDEFRRREDEPCECGNRMTQLHMIRYCRCGFAEGIRIPRCTNAAHGDRYIIRRGSGAEFYCTKCGRRAYIPGTCPVCRQRLDVKGALDSAHFLPFTLSLIDLLDRKKDVFLDNEPDGRGEKVVLARYLELISREKYEEVIAQGRLSQGEDLEEQLRRKAGLLCQAGLDEATIAVVLDAERRVSDSGNLLGAIDRVGQGIAVASNEELKPLAEEVMEYDELLHARSVLTLEEAERDAERLNDGVRPDYTGAAREMGFSRIQLCSGVPIVFAAYGYTRREREGEGVRLHGFPAETAKRNVYATRLETEGVLFELDRERVLDWLVRNGMLDGEELPGDRSVYGRKLWFLDRVRPSRITPFEAIGEDDSVGVITKRVYTLLHSVSHALISEAAELCGLDKSSLSEYILPSIPAVFIYCSNTQGFNMGALYSAFQCHLDRWLRRAREQSKKCVFDPVCIGREKACAGCLFLNEVSCQHFNKDLDRSYLCGYYDSRKRRRLTGFWEE